MKWITYFQLIFLIVFFSWWVKNNFGSKICNILIFGQKAKTSLLKTEYFWKQVIEFSVLWRKSCHDCNLKAKYSQHLLPLRLIPVGDKRDKVCQLLVAYIWSLGTLGFLYKIRNTGSTQDIIPENCVFYDCAASSFLYLHEILISWPICKYIYKIGTDIAQNLEKKVVVAIHHWQWWIVIYFMYDLSL